MVLGSSSREEKSASCLAMSPLEDRVEPVLPPVTVGGAGLNHNGLHPTVGLLLRQPAGGAELGIGKCVGDGHSSTPPTSLSLRVPQLSRDRAVGFEQR